MPTAVKTDTNFEPTAVARAAAKWTKAGEVRRSLEASRSRGLGFAEAWVLATGHLGGEDAAALRATRQHWRAAYEGGPVICGAFGVLRETRAA
jgi:hypothetical protein